MRWSQNDLQKLLASHISLLRDKELHKKKFVHEHPADLLEADDIGMTKQLVIDDLPRHILINLYPQPS